MKNELETLSNEEIGKLVAELTAFASWYAGTMVWFRGGKSQVYLMGKSAEDYAFEAIRKYLSYPEKFDSKRGTFINYLKFHIIRTLVKGDAEKAENQTGAPKYEREEDDGEVNYQENIADSLQECFDDNLDAVLLRTFIEQEIYGDDIAENIFLGLYIDNMKRREIIEEFGMSTSEYDNGMKRVKTVLSKARNYFNPKTKPA